MTFPNPGPASQSTGNVAGGPYAAFSGTNTSQVIGPAGVLVNIGGGVGGGVVLYDGANSITSGTARFSNANGVSFGFNGQTVTASVVTSYTQTVQTQASGAIAGSGFTSTTTAGTAVVGTNNSAGLSLGIPVYITTAAAAQTGISSIADSVRTQSVGMLSFANSNGVTFGLSTGALTATITGSVAAANPGISGIADSANTQTVGTLSFANSNGITFGLSTGANTATITASHGINISASQSSAVVSAVTFSNLNGVTFGYDKTNVTASINSTSGAGGGTTFAGTNISGSMTLNSVGLNLALSGAAGNVPVTRWIWPYPTITAGSAIGNATISLQYVPCLYPVTASRLDLLCGIVATSTTTTNTMAVAISAYAAIYTRNVSSLSSLSSGSTQTTYSYASNNSGNSEFLTQATRPISVPININMTPGEYFVGFNIVTNTSSIGANTTSLGFAISAIVGIAGETASHYAEMGVQTASSNNLLSGMGLYSAASTGLPGALSLSGINATGTNLAKANIALVFRNG